MNYLVALNKQSTIKPTINTPQTVVIENKPETHEEMYIKNVKDSMKSYNIHELQLLCEEFVSDSLYLDYPMIQEHHEGKRNFITEMLCLYESDIDVIITEKEDEEYCSEDELDPSDITDTQNVNNTY